ncbi:hypothetical protein [Methylobacterium planeticum]|uniref:Uncharacterized protein n=1 Tax=Methylobacterium planeticum TaxID=2615211 RepID=A0A6N6MR06_9HYPH|nr:hypothetical protein [Methylobacterium planeticum]KAB1074084.1 hypothetical protein F6X51_10230 [Methylobacterium planeticum]
MPLIASDLPLDLVGDADYLRDVLLNMEWIRHRDDRRVRFCLRGEAGRPDYRTEYPQGHRLQNFPRHYDGRSHLLLGTAGGAPYADADFTAPLGWDDVLTLLKQALDQKHGRARVVEGG